MYRQRAIRMPAAVLLMLTTACAPKTVPPTSPVSVADSPKEAPTTTAQAQTDAPERPTYADPFADVTRPGDCVRPDSFGPIRFDPSRTWERRRFQTTLEQYARSPYVIETCGVRWHYAILQHLTCPDGSQPLAGDSRTARLGTTQDLPSRCGTPVDAYEVPCPSGPIKVYMDGYLCTPDESFL